MSNPRDRMINKYMVYLVEDNKVSTKEIVFPEHNKHHVKEITDFREAVKKYSRFMDEYSGVFSDKQLDILGSYVRGLIARCSVIISVYDEYVIEKKPWDDNMKNSIIKVYNEMDLEEGSKIISRITKMKIDTKIKLELVNIVMDFNKAVKNRTNI